MGSSSENLGNYQADLHAQLWHECAGLTVKIPCIGDRVFYFPQGHLKQLDHIYYNLDAKLDYELAPSNSFITAMKERSFQKHNMLRTARTASCNCTYSFESNSQDGYVEEIMMQEGINNIPHHGLPSKILCKVVDVHLKADSKTEEVYAEIALLPDFDEHEEPNIRTIPQKVPASSFRKILRPSDVSVDGGCGLLQRDAEITFPPLDKNQDPASQTIAAKDLHGSTWHFQHTYRGSQNRHALINGWGKFVRAKQLLAGDACIFLRWQTETYIGVSRAIRLHAPPTDLPCDIMQYGLLSDARISIDTRTPFTVYYYPWTSASPFIVAYDEVMESLKVNYSRGMRFETQFADEPRHILKKFSGVIISKEDIDPVNWPQSEWQCLRVRWNNITGGQGVLLPDRVCPWRIRCLGMVARAPHQQSSIPVNQDGSMPVIRDLPFSRTNGQGNETLTLSCVNTPGSSSEDQPRDKKDGHKRKLFGVYIG